MPDQNAIAAKLEHLIATRSVSLASVYAVEPGLQHADAIEAVRLLGAMSAPVLGGDVYFQRGDKITLAYANWYCLDQVDETHEQYAKRAALEAEAYIREHFTPDDGALFAIVAPIGYDRFDLDLSHAVRLYVGMGSSIYPATNTAAVHKLETRVGRALLARAAEIWAFVDSIEPDWSRHDLRMASDHAVGRTHEKYPMLTQRALDAIFWAYSFGYK